MAKFSESMRNAGAAKGVDNNGMPTARWCNPFIYIYILYIYTSRIHRDKASSAQRRYVLSYLYAWRISSRRCIAATHITRASVSGVVVIIAAGIYLVPQDRSKKLFTIIFCLAKPMPLYTRDTQCIAQLTCGYTNNKIIYYVAYGVV